MMKRKILSILLTLTMTLTLLPATAMAEDVKGVQCDGRDGCDHKVAAIYDGSAGENPGEYHYDTLQAAITMAPMIITVILNCWMTLRKTLSWVRGGLPESTSPWI